MEVKITDKELFEIIHSFVFYNEEKFKNDLILAELEYSVADLNNYYRDEIDIDELRDNIFEKSLKLLLKNID